MVAVGWLLVAVGLAWVALQCLDRLAKRWFPGGAGLGREAKTRYELLQDQARHEDHPSLQASDAALCAELEQTLR